MDEEIANAVTLLGSKKVRAILKHFPNEIMKSWIETLQNLPHLKFSGQYVASEHASLCNPDILENRLLSQYKDPMSLTSKMKVPPGWRPDNVWLLEVAIEIIKFETGNAAGYGYAQLAREVADPNGPAWHLDRKSAEYLLSPWGHLSEWIHRVPHKTLPKRVIKGISLVVSNRLSEIIGSEITSKVSDIILKIQKNIIEAKLCTYRSFEPLRLLIATTINPTKLAKPRSCFGERAKLGSQATRTTLLQKDKTLINWQSVSDAGRDHKKKELCGRAVALRYSWDSKTNKFVPRPGVKKMILVVDGTWRREDLKAMARAGWDEIYYPDEMNDLAKAII